MANYTPNYQLHQWAPEDKFLRTDFNEDLNKIDTALGEGAAKTAALEAAVNKCGNCRIHFQSYVGTGTCGNTAPVRLTFPGKPLVLLVRDNHSDGRAVMAIQGAVTAHTSIFPDSQITLTWSGNSVSWYHYNHPSIQMNQSGVTYLVVALLDLENQ